MCAESLEWDYSEPRDSGDTASSPRRRTSGAGQPDFRTPALTVAATVFGAKLSAWQRPLRHSRGAGAAKAALARPSFASSGCTPLRGVQPLDAVAQAPEIPYPSESSSGDQISNPAG